MIETCIGASLRATMNLGTDITGYSSAVIKLKDPLGVEHSYNATSATPATGAIQVDIPGEDLSVFGMWRSQAVVEVGTETIKTYMSEQINVRNEYE